MVFDSGPSTGAWVQGFTPSEEQGRLTLRWSRARASVSLPLAAPPGPARIRLRAGRMLDQPTRMRLYVAGQPAETFPARPGGLRRPLLFDFVHPGGALDVDLLSDDPELGLAVDWIRIEGLAARPSARAWTLRLLAPGLLLVALLAGCGLPAAAGVGLAGAVALAAWSAVDPFALAHAARYVALPGLALGTLAALGLRPLQGGGAAALVASAAFLVKGAALFHPAYFYPDVRQNHRYVRALAAAEGPRLQDRNHEAQVAVGVGYPRIVGGRRYAFPYSPVFYLPFTPLEHPDAIVVAIKLVALVAVAAEALAIFLLARLWGMPGAALPAAVVSVFLPPVFNRLLYAMWSTVAGHLLDLAVIGAISALALRPGSARRLAASGAALLAALLAYVSSLFNASAFVGFTALLWPRLASRLLPVWLAAVGLVLVWLYGDFVVLFVREIVPAVVAGGGAPPAEEPAGALAALRRIPLFYGWLTPPVAAFGGWLMWRRLEVAPRRMAAAYALAVLLLLGLRAFGGGLFKDLKELELAAPLVAIAVGAALRELAGRGRPGWAVAWLTGAAIAAFGCWRGAQDLAQHTRLLGP